MTWALAIFVAVVVVDAAALLIDFYLADWGIPTITSCARKRPVLGIALLVWQLLGAATLTIHLYG